MRIRAVPNFSTVPKEYDPIWMERTLSVLEEILGETARGINGDLGFGDGTDIDNLVGKWIVYTSNAVSGTEDVVTHDLGVVPIGFLVFKPPDFGTISAGPTPWTTSKLYLQVNAVSQTATIFVVIPSHGITTV